MNKKIYSLGLAQELLKRGHKIIDIEYDYKYRKQIYVFEWCDRFDLDFKDIKTNYNKNK